MAWFPIHPLPYVTRIRFVRYSVIAYVLSALMMGGSVALLMTKGLNFGIDFTGGVLIELRTQEPADLGKMRGMLATQGFGEVSLQNFGDEHEVMIRIQADDDTQAAIVGTTREVLDAEFAGIDYRRVEYVGPTVGRELVRAGIMAFTLSLLGMMVYMWFRFEWQYGVGTVVSQFHDGIIVLGFYSLMGFDFSAAAIAAVLTVIAYSINDTVVIYDRIRENLRKFKKMPFGELLDLSINETLSRTIITSGTTLLALIALAIWGGEIIRGFAIAIAFGIIIGSYSSVYIAAPVLNLMNIRPDPEAATPEGKTA